MLKSLNEIKVIKKENKELWLKYLYETSEKKYNILNVKSLKEITKHSVFNYVLRTLEILDRLKIELCLDDEIVYFVEETGEKKEKMVAGSDCLSDLLQKLL